VLADAKTRNIWDSTVLALQQSESETCTRNRLGGWWRGRWCDDSMSAGDQGGLRTTLRGSEYWRRKEGKRSLKTRWDADEYNNRSTVAPRCKFRCGKSKAGYRIGRVTTPKVECLYLVRPLEAQDRLHQWHHRQWIASNGQRGKRRFGVSSASHIRESRFGSASRLAWIC
jgi:hypothetical protein